MIVGYVRIGTDGLELVPRPFDRDKPSGRSGRTRPRPGRRAELALASELYAATPRKEGSRSYWPGGPHTLVTARMRSGVMVTSDTTVMRAAALWNGKSRIRVVPVEGISRRMPAEAIVAHLCDDAGQARVPATPEQSRRFIRQDLDRSHPRSAFRSRSERRRLRAALLALCAIFVFITALLAAVALRPESEPNSLLDGGLSVSRGAWSLPHPTDARKTILELLARIAAEVPPDCTVRSVRISPSAITLQTITEGPEPPELLTGSALFNSSRIEHTTSGDGTLVSVLYGTVDGWVRETPGRSLTTGGEVGSDSGGKFSAAQLAALSDGLYADAIARGLRIAALTTIEDPPLVSVAASGPADAVFRWLNSAESGGSAAGCALSSVEISHHEQTNSPRSSDAGETLPLQVSAEFEFARGGKPGPDPWPSVDIASIVGAFTRSARGAPATGTAPLTVHQTTAAVDLIGEFRVNGREIFALRFNVPQIVRALPVGGAAFGWRVVAATRRQVHVRNREGLYAIDRRNP